MRDCPAAQQWRNRERTAADVPYVKLLRGAWQLRMIEEQIAKMELSLHTIMQFASIEAVTMMVQHGLGVSIVPRSSVETLLRLPLKIVPFGKPPLYRILGLVQSQGGLKNHLCDAVFDELVRVCGLVRQAAATRDIDRLLSLDDDLEWELQAADSCAAE